MHRFWRAVIGASAGSIALLDHCRCGYDLTGNASGVCPECGTRVAANRQAREALIAAVVSYMKDEISSHAFDRLRQKIEQDCRSAGDESGARVARFLWNFYDESADHPFSVYRENWDMLRRYCAFLRTDLRADAPSVKRRWYPGEVRAGLCLAILAISCLVAGLTGHWLILAGVYAAVGIYYEFGWPTALPAPQEIQRRFDFAPFWDERQWKWYAPLVAGVNLPEYDPVTHYPSWKPDRPSRPWLLIGRVINVTMCPLGLAMCLLPLDDWPPMIVSEQAAHDEQTEEVRKSEA